MKLQRMRFGEPVKQDDKKVVYKASMENPDGVLTLTVTVAPTLYETEELRGFLDGMEAGFVLTAPNPEESTDDDREPAPDLDLDNEILIELGILPHAPDGIFDAIVVVRTAVAGEEDPRAAQLPSAREQQQVVAEAIRTPLPARKDHRWSADGGVIRTATTTARQNSGTLRAQPKPDPHQNLPLNVGILEKGRTTVWVHAGGARLLYDMSAYWHRS